MSYKPEMDCPHCGQNLKLPCDAIDQLIELDTELSSAHSEITNKDSQIANLKSALSKAREALACEEDEFCPKGKTPFQVRQESIREINSVLNQEGGGNAEL